MPKPKPSGKITVDAEQDYHGMTAAQMEIDLQRQWTEWRRLQCVRLIHGQGERLRPVLQQWCEEKGIRFQEERGNSGSILIFPNVSTPKSSAGGMGSVGDALKAAGVTLTPDERKSAQRSAEEQRREQDRLRLVRQELERRKKAAAEVEARRKQQDAQLWQAEISRLDEADRKRGAMKRQADEEDRKPRAPFVATRGRHTPLQEGYWRGELVRIVDTDHETLKEEKQTGLEQLAPPILPKTDAQGNIVPPAPKKKSLRPQRDTAADQALFEEEMRRLDEGR